MNCCMIQDYHIYIPSQFLQHNQVFLFYSKKNSTVFYVRIDHDHNRSHTIIFPDNTWPYIRYILCLSRHLENSPFRFSVCAKQGRVEYQIIQLRSSRYYKGSHEFFVTLISKKSFQDVHLSVTFADLKQNGN